MRIDLKDCRLLFWRSAYGKALKRARGKALRPSVVKQLPVNAKISAEALRLMETGLTKQVRPTVLVELCQVLGIEVSDVISSVGDD